MSESLPKCQWCNEAPVTHPMTDDGVYFHPENGCPSGLGHPVVRLPVRADQWRTLHDQSRSAELEAELIIQNHLIELNLALDAELQKLEAQLVGAHTEIGKLEAEAERLEAENAALREALAEPTKLVLTGAQVKGACQFAGYTVGDECDSDEGITEAEIAIKQCPPKGIYDEEAERSHFYSHIVFYDGYPEEGALGLGPELPAPQQPAPGGEHERVLR